MAPARRCSWRPMPLAPVLKEILVCPRCRGALEFHEDRSEIHCPKCRLIYAIQDDIPNMLVEEARPMKEGGGG